jgi:hypothetical protein
MSVGKLTSSTKRLLKDAQQALKEAEPAFTQIGVAQSKAAQALEQYLADQVPAAKGTNTGGAVGSGGGIMPNKSVFGGDDAAGSRSRTAQLHTRKAQRDLELLKLSTRS